VWQVSPAWRQGLEQGRRWRGDGERQGMLDSTGNSFNGSEMFWGDLKIRDPQQSRWARRKRPRRREAAIDRAAFRRALILIRRSRPVVFGRWNYATMHGSMRACRGHARVGERDGTYHHDQRTARACREPGSPDTDQHSPPKPIHNQLVRVAVNPRMSESIRAPQMIKSVSRGGLPPRQLVLDAERTSDCSLE
jgi:hypothetical protein